MAENRAGDNDTVNLVDNEEKNENPEDHTQVHMYIVATYHLLQLVFNSMFYKLPSYQVLYEKTT